MSDFFQELNEIHIGSLSLMALINVILLLVVCLLVRKAVKVLFDKALAKSHLDGSLKSFLSGAVNVVLWALVIMVVADKLGIPMTSLVALLSVAGLALSLSVQNLLTNLFSGMTILTTRPFAADDFVEIGDTLGTVKSVGLFYTVILSYDGKIVRLPNGTVAAAKVINYSVNPRRRVDLEVCASYNDAPEKVKAALIDAVNSTDGALSDPAPMIGVLEYGSSSIKYAAWVWVDAARFFDVKFALTEAIRRSFKEHGVTMTFNHLNVHLDK